MICKYCNSENSDGAKFCNECGQPLLDLVSTGTKKTSAMAIRRKTTIIGCILALLAVVVAVFLVVNLLKNNVESQIKGVWVRDNTGITSTDTLVYTFTSKGGTNTLNSEKQSQVQGETEFDWYITEDNDLIILWSDISCTRYIWNPDFNSYTLSSNAYNWCIRGDKLYLSTPASEVGYYVFTK